MSDLASIFGGGFDTNSIEPQADFDVLPPGKYPILIEKAEVKQTKAGTGHYLKLQLRVLDGPAKNRVLFDNVNIQNPNQQCTEIGLRTLAALGQALGLAAVGDTAQLLNQVCIAHVKVKNEQNEVRTYSALAPAQPQAAPPAPSQCVTQQPAQPCSVPPQVATPAPPVPPAPPRAAPPQQAAPPQVASQPPQQTQAPQQAPPAAAAGKPPWAR